ncbi:hypothetical protein JCM10213_002708 [Rhodosporidiobolus nylandii]
MSGSSGDGTAAVEVEPVLPGFASQDVVSSLRSSAARLAHRAANPTPLTPTSLALASRRPGALACQHSTSLPPQKAPAAIRALGTSSKLGNTVSSFANAFLHGSEEAQQEQREQHSKLVGRGKFIHEFQKHKVLPQHVQQYKDLIASYYEGIHQSDEFHARLTGSWEIVVGEVDTFVHIWEYEGLPGFEKTKGEIMESKGHLQFFNHEILPLIQSRTSQLNREFAFWQTSPATEKGGIYELRTYNLQPGTLLEWESSWRVGLEARLQTGHYPVGAWFSQIGPLHQVHHMWNYPSLESRSERRAESWKQDAWSGTVSKTTRLTSSMQTNILKPLPFSPLR